MVGGGRLDGEAAFAVLAEEQAVGAAVVLGPVGDAEVAGFVGGDEQLADGSGDARGEEAQDGRREAVHAGDSLTRRGAREERGLVAAGVEDEKKDEDDEDDRADAGDGVVAPVLVVLPDGKSADQSNDDEESEDEDHEHGAAAPSFRVLPARFSRDWSNLAAAMRADLVK